MSDLSISVNLPGSEPRGRLDVVPLLWPRSRVGEALDELARRSGLGVLSNDAGATPASLSHEDDEDLVRWIPWVAGRGDSLDQPHPERVPWSMWSVSRC